MKNNDMNKNLTLAIVITFLVLVACTVFVYFLNRDERIENMKEAGLISEEVVEEEVVEEDVVKQTDIDWIGYDIPEVDDETFEVISERYAKDVKSVYYQYTEQIEDEEGGVVERQSYRITGVNPQEFAFVQNIDTQHIPWEYIKDSEHVYFVGATEGDGLYLVEGADPETFGMNNEPYITGADAEYKYAQHYRIDEETFEPLSEFMKDRNRVYSHPMFQSDEELSALLPLLDSESFRKIHNSYYADNTYVISRKVSDQNLSGLIEGADPETFEVLMANKFLSKDKNAVFLFTDIVEGADPETFKFFFQPDKGSSWGAFYVDAAALYYLDDKNQARFETIADIIAFDFFAEQEGDDVEN